MALAAAAATTLACSSYINSSSCSCSQSQEYSRCWYPTNSVAGEQCQNNKKNRRKKKNKQSSVESASSNWLCSEYLGYIHNQTKPYHIKSHQTGHLSSHHLCPSTSTLSSMAPSSSTPASHSQALSLPCTVASTIITNTTPSSSSLMSNSLINIHRHTSYLCQILELLRTVASTTTTHNSSSTTVVHATTTASSSTSQETTTTTTTTTPSGTTIIKSILTDKVNEPVKYLTTMMEQQQQQEDISIQRVDSSNKSSMLSTPPSSPSHDQCTQCVHQHQLSTAPNSGLISDRLRLPSTSNTPTTNSHSQSCRVASPSSSPHPSPCSTSSSVSPPMSTFRSDWSRPVSALLGSLVPSLPSVTSSATSSLFLTILLLFTFMLHTADSCSSRSTPKPRPPTPTTRPNITFQTFACPEAYAKWYCLNGATCFSVRIGESILYNCECADGYMGQRCEFKDLDGSYLPSREKILVETAGIAGGVTLTVLLVVVFSITYYTYLRNHMRAKSPPLLGYSHEQGALDHDDNDAFYSSYHHNIKQHYQPHYSTFKSSSTASSTLPQAAVSAKYVTYGETMIPSTRINYEQLSHARCLPPPPSRQCIACMSKLHQHEIKSSLNQKEQQSPVANVLDLEHGIAHQSHHSSSANGSKNPFSIVAVSSSPSAFC